METKKEIEEKIYNNNRILSHWNKKIEDIERDIELGKDYKGRIFVHYEIKNLKKLIDDMKKAKERTVIWIAELQKKLKEVNK